MGLFRRISDIVSANMHDLVDEAEDPEATLKQAVDEMGRSITDARRATARAIANQKLLTGRLADSRAGASMWHDRAAEAVRAGDDERARRALLEKQERDKTTAALSGQLEAAGESVETLRRQLGQMQGKLTEAKRSTATLTARHRAAQTRRQAVEPEATDDAFARFDRMSEKVAMAEAEADAMCELATDLAPRPEPLGESVASSDEADVDAELVALKQKLGG